MTTTAPTERLPSLPRDEPTAAEMVARAAELIPYLLARQADTENEGNYSLETHKHFSGAGFYRILVPRRYGGYQLGVDAFLRVVRTLARGCPSTAWMYCLGASGALTAASRFSGPAQADLFRTGEFIAPASIVPGGYAEPSPGGGWLVNGSWSCCPGSTYATHFIGHVMSEQFGEPPAPMLFIAPRTEWQQLEDRQPQLGLRGSGRHGISMAAGRVPDYFTLTGAGLDESHAPVDTPGFQLHGDPGYASEPLSYLLLDVAALAVGIAQGALDAYEELLRSRLTVRAPFVTQQDDPDYQLWYGEAVGLVATAEAAVTDVVRQHEELCRTGRPASNRAEKLRLAIICRHAVQLCWQAVERFIFPTAGAHASLQGERIERIWRDMSMLHNHSAFSVVLSTVTNRELARARLGLD